MTKIVIVGGGHAAAQLCADLAGTSFEISLVSQERIAPYHRPPLSKGALSAVDCEPQEIRGAGFYTQFNIRLLLGTTATSIDRAHRLVSLQGDTGPFEIAYDHLVLATGAAPRLLAAGDANAIPHFYLRGQADVLKLRACSAALERVAVVGAGFIGLEVACTLRALGKDVKVFARDRLLGRVVSPAFSQELLRLHRRDGLCIEFTPYDRLRHAGFDAVVVGIGSLPRIELAVAAGLACDEGVVVDEFLRTSDSNISAIGDCAAFVYQPWRRRIRIESVYNANAQARVLAQRLKGEPVGYRPAPWFWSDQGGLRLQMAGMWRPALRQESVPVSGDGVALYHHDDAGLLVASECIGSPHAHMAARRRLETFAPA